MRRVTTYYTSGKIKDVIMKENIWLMPNNVKNRRFLCGCKEQLKRLRRLNEFIYKN